MIWTFVFVGIFVVLAAFNVFLECGAAEILVNILEDRQNRNDRGKGKRPSDKYVC